MNRAIYFKGENCSVCKALLPKVQTHIHQQYPLLAFELVSVQEQPEFAAHYNVYTIPVLIIELEGKENFRFIRNFSTGQIDQKLERSYQLLFQ